MLLKIIEENTFVTVGCTDPVAVGLAASTAFNSIGGEIEEIRLSLDKNIYKDALSVGIPGTLRSGLDLAVALSVLYGDPTDGLRLLKNVEESDIANAEDFIKQHKITFCLKEDVDGIYVKADVITSLGKASALIRYAHDRIEEIEVNGEKRRRDHAIISSSGEMVDLSQISDLSIKGILDFVSTVSGDKILFLNDGIEMNLKAAEMGLKDYFGLGTGKRYENLILKDVLSDDLVNRTKKDVGSAADARMAGLNVPIYGCFGSGNHGITLFTTIGNVARYLDSDPVRTSRALALALLVVGVIKAHTGVLTPHCGCSVAAGTGAAAGITYLLGGDDEQIENACHMMLANLTGMLCDGAKYGCSLKMVASAGAAIESSYLALEGAHVPDRNGIIGSSFSKTMKNLLAITQQGMGDVDRAILDILLSLEN